jgi:hypothetical protein
MPTGAPNAVNLFPAQINVPHLHLYIGMNVQSDGTPEGDAALGAVLQELIDLLQTWPGRLADVTGQLYGATLASVTPTDPDPLPDPPEPEPEGELAPEALAGV